MNAYQLGAATASAVQGIAALGIIFTVLLAGFVPFMVWSIARNIKQIRVQLERLNDTLAARGAGEFPADRQRTSDVGRLVT